MKPDSDRIAAGLERLRSESMFAVPTFLVSAVTSATFVQVFGGREFFWPLISVATIVHGFGILLRTARLPSVLAVFAPAASVVIAVGWLRFSDTLWFGLPLSTTWQAMWTDVHGAWTLIGDVVTPVEFAGGFGTAAMLVIGFVAAVTDAFASRYGGRAEAFVPAAATLFVVATVGTGQDRLALSSIWLMTALFATALIRRHRRRRADVDSAGNRRSGSATWTSSVRSAIGVLVFVGLIGFVAATVAPQLPGAGEEAWITQRTQGGARELQPLVDIRRRLTQSSPEVLFTVRADAASYWRIGSLSDFDGDTWTISQDVLDSAAGDLAPPVGAGEQGVASIENFQRFAIRSLTGSLVPVAATPTRLRASSQSLFYEPGSGSLLMGGDGLRPDDAYEIVSTMLAPEPARLDTATADGPPSDAFLALPDDDVIDQLRTIASSIAPQTLSAYQQALALQDYFRTQFTYSLDVPDLTSSNATLEFLERRTGYCEHFASTFALFARTIGLPARVAIGFTPGDKSTSESGTAEYTVRSTHAHAWPEVWFDGLGWILFEPTPGRGAPNSAYTNVPEEQAEAVSPPSTAPSTTTTTTLANDQAAPSTTSAPEGGTTGTSPIRSGGTTMWPYVVLALVASAIALWSTVLPRAVRRIVTSRGDAPLIVLWRRAIALYELERGPLPDSLSPLELAERATSRLYDDDPFIFELAESTTRILFGAGASASPETADLLERGDTYLRTRRSRLAPSLRLRARLDPFTMWRLEGGSSRH